MTIEKYRIHGVIWAVRGRPRQDGRGMFSVWRRRRNGAWERASFVDYETEGGARGGILRALHRSKP